MANALFFILGITLGLLIGYWGQAVYNKLLTLQAELKERRLYEESGIVKPRVTPVQQIPRVDLTSPTGGVRRPSPDEVLIQNMKDRDAHLKQM